jgi:hypothetical protein
LVSKTSERRVATEESARGKGSARTATARKALDTIVHFFSVCGIGALTLEKAESQPIVGEYYAD